jgi:vacuolar-type H+-ATPase subunit I/STV1
MPLINVKTYQVHGDISELDNLINSISTSGLTYQVLDRKELDESWNQTIDVTVNISDHKSKIEILDEAVSFLTKKSFFDAIVDARTNVKVSSLKAIIEKEDYLIDFAKVFVQYNRKLEHANNLAKLNKSLKKNFIFGNNLSNLIKDFIDSPILKVQNFKDDYNINSSLFNIQKQKDIEFIANKNEYFSLLCDFIDLTKPKDVFYYSSFVTTSREELSSLEKKLQNYSSAGKNNLGILKNELIELHAYYDLIDETNRIKKKFFTLDSNSSKYFGFIAVIESDSQKLEEIFNNHNLTVEEVKWNKQIVKWNNPNGLKGFQSVVEPLGTVSKKEFDPTGIVSVFFMLFFALCLGDAIYGVIIVLFTGYFLYFKQIKKDLEPIFNLFFFSGVATVLYGALINSWAGNLFTNTPLAPIFESFALIDPLNAEASAPINLFLKSNGGVHPIVAMLGFSLLIGFSNILSAYAINAYNSLSKESTISKFSPLIYFVFLVSVILSIGLGALSSPLSIFAFSLTGITGLSLFIFNDGKNIFSKILGGLSKFYDIINFFADTLSFTRLVAVGLSSGIIANVVNLLATLVFEGVGGIGGVVLGGIVLIAGHLFNLVLAIFAAYINPLRLNYVEFLPKFYKGESKSIAPEILETKYAKVTT